MPPTQHQHGNASVMSFSDLREALFEELDKQGGIITKACRALGVSFHSVHRERLRDPLFRQELELRIAEARRNHAAEMMALADTHVDNHLRHSLVPLLDAEGAPVLDDDFEPVLMSQLALKAVVDARREYRTQLEGSRDTLIHVNNVAAISAQTEAASNSMRPRLVVPDRLSVAEIKTISE
jgi:hypothetical protein